MIASTTIPEPTTKPKRKPTARRGNGEGSIYQRADSRWCASVTLGYNAVGKRVRRTVYGTTKGEVQEKLGRLSTSKLDGTLCEPNKMTTGEFLARWLADVVKPTKRVTTATTYAGVIKKQILPRIGGIPLTKLTPMHIQNLYRLLSETARSESTSRRRQVHNLLHGALDQAVKWQMVPRNVCDAVERPRHVQAEMQVLSSEQASALLAAAEGDRSEALFTMALTTGMRLGELLALQWRDVDWEGRAVAVRYTLNDCKGVFVLGEPKSKSSKRRVSLDTLAVEALGRHQKHQMVEGFGRSEFVFCNTAGMPWRRANLHKNAFKPLLKRAGLPDIRFHDLRHTAATLMLTGGVHPKIVQQRLGHANISMTLDLYSHVMPGMDAAAADVVGGILRAGQAKLKLVSETA